MQKNFLLFNSLRDKRPGRELLAYIYDFSRYEKSSSMKRPTLKVIDFDSVVQNTKSSKSIILMAAFSNILLQSRSSEATNIGYRFSSRAVFGWILFELNSGCGNLGERVEDISFCPQIPSSCLIHLLQPQHRNHWGQWLRL